MTSLNNDLFGGSEATKAAYLKKGVVLGKSISTVIPKFSGSDSWGAKQVIRWQQYDSNAPFTNVVKDLLLHVKLGAITQTSGDSNYIQGIGLSLFRDLVVKAGGVNITQSLDCEKLWPFLVYCTRFTEFTRLQANLHMNSSAVTRRGEIDIFLPMDLLFSWANGTPLDIVNQNELQVEFTYPQATDVIVTTGTYVVPSILKTEFIVDREYNRPYINALVQKYKEGFQVEDPNSFQQLVVKPGFSLPDFDYISMTKNVGASDTYSFIELGQVANRRIVALFFYLQLNSDLTSGVRYNNYKPINNARLYHASHPLDNTDTTEYKDYRFFHSMIDNVNSLPNVLQYLIGTDSSGSTNANMVIVDYSDANLEGVGYTSSAANRFAGYCNWKDMTNPRFEINHPALGAAGTLTAVAICYKELAIVGNGNPPGLCTIREIIQ